MTAKIVAPPHSCDSHMHIFGPAARYKGGPNRSYTPDDKPIAPYEEFMSRLGFERLVFVQPSGYGSDNSCLLDAMTRRPETSRAIAVVDPDIGDDELAAMNRAGVRGIRLNIQAMKVADPKAGVAGALTRYVRKIEKLGWHVQIYAAVEDVAELLPTVRTLDVPFVFDHMAGVESRKGENQKAFDQVLDLLAAGKCWVKFSGADIVTGMTGNDKDLWNAAAFGKALVKANPDNLVFGTDWPHLVHMHGGIGDAAPPAAYRDVGESALLHLLRDCVGNDDAAWQKILVENPRRLYGFA